MGKLTKKGKHKVKVGNHSDTNMIPKPATVRREEYKCQEMGNAFEVKRSATETLIDFKIKLMVTKGET